MDVECGFGITVLDGSVSFSQFNNWISFPTDIKVRAGYHVFVAWLSQY